MTIHYEPHPVSPERKAELRAQGLKILDARFAPKPNVSGSVAAAIIEAEAPMVGPQGVELFDPRPKRRGRKPKVAE